MRIFALLVPLMLVIFFGPSEARGEATFNLSSIDSSSVRQDWGQARVNRSISGGPLSIAGKQYSNGIGTHANSSLPLDLSRNGRRFRAWVGVDDAAPHYLAKLIFQIYLDSRLVWTSDTMVSGQPARKVDLDIRYAQYMELAVWDADNGIGGDHANWCEAQFEMDSIPPVVYKRPSEQPYILSPPAPPEPVLNLVPRYGVRPGSEVLYRVPCTGQPPIEFEVENLPSGLLFEQESRTIRGRVSSAGTYRVDVFARNSHGQTSGALDIVVGDTFSLTPLLGWSSWYPYTNGVNEGHVRLQAQIMLDSGLADYGYDHVLIDEGWQAPERSSDGLLVPHSGFVDMAQLVRDMHSRGLKFGIYSSPGPLTCPGNPGSYGHELQDAELFCGWEVDYFKSDLCSYTVKIDSLFRLGYDTKKVTRDIYLRMGELINKCNRDIHYYVCGYGLYEPYLWGREVYAQSWRTTGDVEDDWWGICEHGFSQNELAKYAGPGGWNDIDHLRLGYSGMYGSYRPGRLSPDEMYTKVSLWAMLKTKMVLGFYLDQADPFVFSLIRNRELVQITTDPLGKQATRLLATGRQEIWTMPMSDSSIIVGMFNRDDFNAMPIRLDLARLGIRAGAFCRVRDVWRNRDIGTFTSDFESVVPSHGVRLLRIWPNQVSSVNTDSRSEHTEITVYPNPSNGQVSFSMVSRNTGWHAITIYRSDGSVEQTSNHFASAGEQMEVKSNVGSTGLYFATISCERDIRRTKFVVVKGEVE